MKNKSKRPNGLDISAYKNCESWSYHEWAWEFLRRDVDFIAECKKVKLGEISKQKVARRVGLKKFKFYNEWYLKKSVPPKFTIATPFVWSNLNEGKKKGVRRINLNLFPGQLIARLDLAASAAQVGAIDVQVRELKKIIDEKVSDFKIKHKALAKAHKPKEETFGIYIRLLDLKAAGLSHLKCANILLTKEVKNGATPDELRENIKQRLKGARRMAKDDYKYLSVKDGRPPEGTRIPLEVSD